MLKLTDICEYIRARVEVGEGVTAGVIDEKTKRCIGVYDNNRSQSARMALGGAENTKYRKQKITVLVHWGSTQTAQWKKPTKSTAYFAAYPMCVWDARALPFLRRMSRSASVLRRTRYASMLSP